MVKEVSKEDLSKNSDQQNVKQETEKDLVKKIEQEKLRQELEENSKPLKLTQAFVDRPFLVILICAFVFILATIVTAIGKYGEMAKDNDRDFLIWSDERTEDFDTLIQAQEDFQKSLIDSIVPVRTIPETRWSTFLVFENEKKKNLLTPDGIKFIYEMEQKIKNLKNYKNFCLATAESTECSEDVLYSLTTLFNDPSNLSQQEIDNEINDIVNDVDDKWVIYKGLFSDEFGTSNTESYLVRSMFTFAGPLDIDGKRYKDVFDDEEGQSEKFDEFSQEILDICNDDDLKKPDNVDVLPYSQDLLNVEMGNVADKDLSWAIGSIIFVLLYLGFHLKSIFLSSMSMLSILFSFPITLVLFGLVFQIEYFSTLHILVVFIVLGIAADNVFVFTDAWNQTAFYEQLGGDLNKRMAVTFRRASKAMLATSSTTGAAFLATGFSPIMPISSFGFFAGILIPVNFILVITFYPAILIVYTKYTKNMCVRKQKYQDNNKQGSPRQVSNSNDQIQNEQQNQQQEEKPAEGKIERFFENQFNNFVFKGRFPILALFAVWTAIAAWRTTQLPSLSKPEQFLPDDHPSQRASNLMRYDFHQSGNSDTGIKVYHIFGVKGIDKDGVGMWDPTDLGKVKYDEDFDLKPKANQQYIYDTCKTMESSPIVQDGLVNCFMVDFKSFVESKGQQFPVEPSLFMSLFTEFTEDTDYNGAGYYNENLIGLMKGELKYVVVELASIGIPFAPHKELNPTFEKWDDYVKDVNKNAPAGLKHSKQTAKIGWCFMITEKAFSSSAIQGTLISLAFAFVVLILTTHNIIIASYSILSIIGIVVSVISIMEMAGWELGVAESVAIVILIGMSVDYVVHLATHYVECSYNGRYEKMQQSLKDLGISIISGASTTIGSGIFLFFATMTLFTKFAVLICGTILFSLAYALIFFAALNHVVGPQGEQGNLRMLFKKKGKQEEEKANKEIQQPNQDVEQQK